MPSTSVIVRVSDLQPDFQKAVIATCIDGKWDEKALQQVVSHEFDFMAFWTKVAISHEAANAADTTLTLTFEAPDGRDFAAAEKAFAKATRRGERGDLAGAIQDLEKLTAEFPEVAKYWRALGQGYLVTEQWESTEDVLLKSLALDALDPASLTLLGNLYAKRGKLDRASALYHRSLQLDKTVWAMSNAASMLAKAGDTEQALRLFREAVAFDATHPNAWYGLALTLANKRDVGLLPEAISALDSALATIGERAKLPEVWDAAQGLVAQLSTIEATDEGNRSEPMLRSVTEDVERLGGVEVRTESAPLRGILAKIELSWVHGRDYHRIIVDTKSGIERVHQIRHELEHARLASIARAAGVNKWFAADDQTRALAHRAVSADISRLQKQGIPASEVARLSQSWVDGLNGQLYNFPVDLMIESTLLRDHPEFRELWFVALEKQMRLAIRLAEDKELASATSRVVFRSNVTMNAVFALWFEDNFPRRTDILARFKRIDTYAQAKKLYEMWKEDFGEWTAGAEIEWVDRWAKVLGLTGWYKWIDGNT